jgi:hypothetical protein
MEPVFLNVYGAQESIPIYEFRQPTVCSLAGRYDNPIPTRCLTPIDCLKIPALNVQDMSASGFDLKGLCQAIKKLVFVLFEQQVHICILTRSRAKNWYFSCKNIMYDSTRS